MAAAVHEPPLAGVNGHPAAGGFRAENYIWSADDYETVRALGEGGFGAVVLARRRDSGELVAVKSLRRTSACGDKAHAAAAAAAADEILIEASFLAVCAGHPSLVALKAVAVHPLPGEPPSLVMEYVGPSLHDVLYHHRHGEPLPEAAVRRVMRQLLSGAGHMHARHIVHRDIKPKNILVGHGAVKICDLGLAMSLEVAPPYGRAGTTPYTAPELLLGKRDYGSLIDMWSLGCVMAELLHGKLLFSGPSDGAVLRSIFRVLGAPSCTSWPAFTSLPHAGDVKMPPGFCCRNRLREIFPEACLSGEGFSVLNGLLSCNPDKRLSATIALQHPWFSDA